MCLSSSSTAFKPRSSAHRRNQSTRVSWPASISFAYDSELQARSTGSLCANASGQATRGDASIGRVQDGEAVEGVVHRDWGRSEEHTSELQSQSNLVCR